MTIQFFDQDTFIATISCYVTKSQLKRIIDNIRREDFDKWVTAYYSNDTAIIFGIDSGMPIAEIILDAYRRNLFTREQLIRLILEEYETAQMLAEKSNKEIKRLFAILMDT